MTKNKRFKLKTFLLNSEMFHCYSVQFWIVMQKWEMKTQLILCDDCMMMSPPPATIIKGSKNFGNKKKQLYNNPVLGYYRVVVFLRGQCLRNDPHNFHRSRFINIKTRIAHFDNCTNVLFFYVVVVALILWS